ncbi:hypothetical protein BJ165DRAFT_167867 [Panaeolus papilionaceus]|nr:hypothetical protein BJ165DRAFT_167867 [Panaeolus papilionaceus]
MASSTLSLDSLSSPSPSPSPPPQHNQNRTLKQASTQPMQSSTPTTASAQHKYKPSYRSLDEDSELSELTEAEDDQDPSIPQDKRAISDSTTPGGSSSSAVPPTSSLPVKPNSSSSSMKKPASNAGSSSKESEEQGMTSSSSKTGGGRRGTHQRSASSRRGGPGRRTKRSSIVPAPMWGWADPKPAAATPAEEEEEEMPLQPKIMEEEEEEEEAEEEEEEEGDDYDPDDHRKEGSPGVEEEEEEEDRARSVNYYPRNPYGQKAVSTNKTRGTAKRGGRRQPASSSRKYDDDAASGDNEPTKTWTRSKPPSSSTTSIRKARQKDINNDDNEDSKDASAVNGADKGDDASGGSAYPSPNLPKKAPARRSANTRRPAASPKSISDTENPPPTSTSRKKRVNGASAKPPRTSAATRNNNVESESEPHANDDPPSSDDEKTDSEPDPTPKKSAPGHIPPSPTKSLAKPLSSANAAKPNSKVSSSTMPSAGTNTNAAALALSALAAAADAVDPTDPGSRAVASINAAAASASIMAGSTSLVEPVSKSDSQADDAAGNGGVSSAAADNTPSGSRSPSPGAVTDDESEQSADEPVKTTRGGRGRRGKPNARGARARGRASRAGGRKGPPPALRIDTSVEDGDKTVAVGGDDAMDVDDQDETSAHPDTAANDRDSDDGANNEADDPEPEEEEEEDSGDERSVQGANDQEEQAEEEQVDGDEEAQERERDAEQAVDNDAEREPDNDAEDRDQENEVDNDEEAANDADMDADDHESDLQPAHRAEALDVLANIELKFALLRERVYVEKMEELGWEERLVKEGAHPEMIHLQKELSKRKDKRLELASRKRSYEVAHATKRRKRDEEAIWSWWKFTTEELQTEMIAETSRKRRKIERERRAMERPQPVRRIPAPIPQMIPPPPSIRKIIKSYPFGSRKHNKSDLTNIYPQLSNHFPRHYVYPEITTLSANEISSDLDYLLANRRQPYEAYPPLQMPQSYSQQGLQRTSGPSSLGRNGLGMSNGQTSAPQLGMMGPPGSIPPSMSYDQYGDVQMSSSQPTFGPGGPPPPSGRMRDNPPQPGPGGPPPRPENPYPSFPLNSSNRSHPHSQGSSMPIQGTSSHGFPPGHGYPGEHEPNAAGAGVSSSGGGHQLHPHHPYFSQGSMMGPGGSYPSSSAQVATASNSSHAGPGMKNAYNRRSVSPPHMQPNGSSGSGSKHWSGPGMGGYPPVNGKGVEWDPRIAHEEGERERERAMREREREFRKREEREKDRDVPDRERAARYREREYEERERERQREMQLQQSSSQHGGLPSGPPHLHPSGSREPPPPSSQPGGSSAIYHAGSHHHHRPAHHHHIVHRHYGQGGSQHPHNSPIPGPAVAQSPRAGREYDRPSSSMHSAPPNEPSSNPSASKGPGGPPRDRDPSWQGKGPEEPPHPSGNDYEPGNRDREAQKPRSRRPSPGPPMVPLDRDRPLATPFVMASTQTMQQLNGAASSPRNGPSWNGPGSSSEDAYRGHGSSSAPSQSYGASPHDAHMRSPVQRYAPANRAPSSGSSQTPFHRMGSPPPPVSRARPPLSPPYPSHQARSPLTRYV